MYIHIHMNMCTYRRLPFDVVACANGEYPGTCGNQTFFGVAMATVAGRIAFGSGLGQRSE